MGDTVIDKEVLQLVIVKNLRQALRMAPEKKCLVLEGHLIKLLDEYYQGMATLREENVTSVKMFGSALTGAADASSFVFVLEPTGSAIQAMSRDVATLGKHGEHKSFYVIFYPARSGAADVLMEQYGLYDVVHIIDMPVVPVPFDFDVVSLEWPGALEDIVSFGDQTTAPAVAQCLRNLNALVGPFGRVLAKGAAATRCLKLLERDLRVDEAEPTTAMTPTPLKIRHVNQVVIIDRQSDPYSVCLTPGTFESLLADHFVDEYTTRKISVLEEPKSSPPSTTAGPTGDKAPPAPKLLTLRMSTSVEPMLLAMCGKTVPAAMKDLRRTLAVAQDETREIHGMDATKLSSFVKERLADARRRNESMTTMVEISQRVVVRAVARRHSRNWSLNSALLTRSGVGDVIDELLDRMCLRQRPVSDAIRHCMLLRLTAPRDFFAKSDVLLRHFVHAYGPEHLITWNKLFGPPTTGAGSQLLTPLNHSSFFLAPFTLWKDKKQHSNLMDNLINCRASNATVAAACRPMHEVFADVAPPSVRLVEEIVFTHGCSWDAAPQRVRDALPGDTLDATFRSPYSSPQFDATSATLVFYVGGVTWPELTAWRAVAHRRKASVLVGTTCVVSGRATLKTFMAHSN